VRPTTKLTDRGTGNRPKVERSKIAEQTPCRKQGYSSRKMALERAAVARRETGEEIEAYKCRNGCHCWHIGHPPGSRERAS
jgi:hypothetical protein